MRQCDTSIHVLARAIIRVGDVVLVAQCKGANNTFLPGGHVNAGERMHDAIARELKEEFGHRCIVGEYVGAIEHAFAENGATQHEINHLFRVELPDVRGAEPIVSLERHLEFFWHSIDKLDEVNLKPAPLITMLKGSALFWASTLPHATATEDT